MIGYASPTHKARWGLRMGHAALTDSMIKDGLWDPYGDCHMGSYAELCAETLCISREEQVRWPCQAHAAEYSNSLALQDVHAEESYARSLAAISAGSFEEELIPLTVPKGKAETEEASYP